MFASILGALKMGRKLISAITPYGLFSTKPKHLLELESYCSSTVKLEARNLFGKLYYAAAEIACLQDRQIQKGALQSLIEVVKNMPTIYHQLVRSPPCPYTTRRHFLPFYAY